MTTDEQQIRELVTKWMDATRAGDIDTVMDLMTEDVVFLVAGQPAMEGRAAFAEAAAGASPDQQPEFDGTSEIQEIEVIGDWAHLWTKLSVVVTPPGGAAPIKRAGHTLSILRKEAGRWRIARDANMLASVAE